MDARDDRHSIPRLGRFQFRLSELLVFVTVAAVVFGMVGWWGIDGTFERLQAALFVASLCAAVMEIHYQIKHNLGQ